MYKHTSFALTNLITELWVLRITDRATVLHEEYPSLWHEGDHLHLFRCRHLGITYCWLSFPPTWTVFYTMIWRWTFSLTHGQIYWQCTPRTFSHIPKIDKYYMILPLRPHLKMYISCPLPKKAFEYTKLANHDNRKYASNDFHPLIRGKK